MTRFTQQVGRLVAAFSLAAAVMLAPAATEAGLVRGVHHGRGLHRHPVARAVHRPAFRRVAPRVLVAPRVIGIGAPPVIVEPAIVPADCYDCVE